MQHRTTLALSPVGAHCWLMFSLVSSRGPRSFSSKLLSSRFSLKVYWCLPLFFYKWRTLHLLLLNSMRFLQALFSRLSENAWEAPDSDLSFAPPGLLSFANYVLSPGSLMKMLNTIGPNPTPGLPWPPARPLVPSIRQFSIQRSIQPVLHQLLWCALMGDCLKP